MAEQHPWMVAVLLPSPQACETIHKVLGSSVDRREGRHDLALHPVDSFLCRRGDLTIWADHFAEPWRDSSGQEGDADSPLYSDRSAKDRLVAEPWCLRRAIEQHHGEASSAIAAENHREYLMLRVPLQPAGHAVAAYDVLLDLAREVMERIPRSVFFNPRAEVVCDGAELRQIRERYRSMGLPPVELIFNTRRFTLPGGWALADSVGLCQLELPDQEVAFNEPALGAAEAMEFVRNLAKHLIKHRTPISNGDTAGGPKGTLWEAMLLGQATIAPHRRIIRWLPENRDGMPPGLDVP